MPPGRSLRVLDFHHSRNLGYDGSDFVADPGGSLVKQRIDCLAPQPPACDGHKPGDPHRGQGVAIFEPQRRRTQTEENENRAHHVGREVDGICRERLATGLARHPAKGANPSDIDNDGHDEHAEGEDSRLEFAAAGLEPLPRLRDHHGCQDEKDDRLGKGRHALEFAVPVLVPLIRRLVCGSDRQIGHDGGGCINQRVGGFREQGQRSGEQASHQLGDGDTRTGSRRRQRHSFLQRGAGGVFIGSGEILLCHEALLCRACFATLTVPHEAATNSREVPWVSEAPASIAKRAPAGV